MGLFSRKPESPAEKQALAKLDEATRGVAWAEETKEGEREKLPGFFGALKFFPGFRRVPFRRVPGDPVPEPVDDPDPSDSRSLSAVLHEHDDSA